jgi:glycosyltransferase involved in cell wall biosynthesis
VIVAPGLRQAAAINRGVEAAHGDIIIVLNADDVLYPGAVSVLVRALVDNPDVAAVYADAVHIDALGHVISPYPTQPFSLLALNESCIICHPASAVRRSVFREAGGFDTSLDVIVDYEFWIRLAQKSAIGKIDGLIAGSRMHPDNKTLGRRGDGFREVRRTLLRYFGFIPYTWSFAYTAWLLGDTDPFFAPARPSRLVVIASLAVGVALNWRRPGRYVRDWFAHRSAGTRNRAA